MRETPMPIVATESWMLELPEEWSAEEDEEEGVVVIEDEDGVSCLEISALVLESGTVGDEDLAEFSGDLLDEGLKPQAVRVAGWSGKLFEHDDEEFHWREWFLRHEGIFVYGAYHCLGENLGMDDAAIDEILSTLELRPPAA
jgi:hypothetical protein